MPGTEPNTTVLVAGAAGSLGHRIAAALAMKPKVTVKALVRPASATTSDERDLRVAGLSKMGVELVTGDVNHTHSLPKAVQGVDVVVSALQGPPDMIVYGQTNLLKAAQEAGVKKFIPSTFSLNMFNIPEGEHPFLDSRLKFAKILEKSGMPHVHILNGCFTETFWGFLSVFHKDGPSLQYWGDGEKVFDVTTFDDTARYTAEAALREDITGVLEVSGEALSFKQAAQAFREVKGEIKEISLGGIEDLKRTIQQRQRQDPSNWAAYMPLKYLLPMVDGRGKLENIGNNRFPNIKPISMRDYLHKVGDLPEPGY